MKYILLIPDGAGDLPRDGDGLTPLKSARKENISYLQEEGLVGLSQTIPYGFPPGSDIGTMSIFGLHPNLHRGRAPIEASAKYEIEDDAIVFRVNFVSVSDEGVMLDHSAGHIKDDKATELLERVIKRFGNDIKFLKGVSYRNYAIIRGNKEYYLNLKTTPPHDIIGEKIEKYIPEDEIIKRIMIKSREVLDGNMLWFWGQGVKPKFPKFEDIWGKRGCLVSAVDLVKGIGKLMGLHIFEVEGATGYLDTNFEGKVQAVLDGLKYFDFGVIHIEATDETGHEGDFEKKKLAIELFDKRVVGEILKNGKDFRILIVPDHRTPIKLRTHSSHPVPFLLYPYRGSIKLSFDEESAEKSPIFIWGRRILSLLFHNFF